jgi:hypothetical protein
LRCRRRSRCCPILATPLMTVVVILVERLYEGE